MGDMAENRILVITLSVFLILGLVTPAFASPPEILYMVSKGSGTNAPSQLWTVDRTTGDATALPSPVGFSGCSSMEFHSGVLYAACEPGTPGDNNDNRLITINTVTGIGTDVGSNSVIGFNYAGMSALNDVGAMYTYQPGSLGLGTFNLGTGLYTSTENGNHGKGGNGMAFDPNDGSPKLYISRATGDATADRIFEITNLITGAEDAGVVIGYGAVADLADNDKVVAMDYSDQDAVIWAAIKADGTFGDGGGAGNTWLVTINPTTGVLGTPEKIVDYNNVNNAIPGVDGIAFQPALGDFVCWDPLDPEPKSKEFGIIDQFGLVERETWNWQQSQYCTAASNSIGNDEFPSPKVPSAFIAAQITAS